jgi:hypothetical protein
MLLARLYDRHAEECARAAEQTDDPRHRALLMKCAAEWREAAQALRQSGQPEGGPAERVRDRSDRGSWGRRSAGRSAGIRRRAD